MKSIKKTVFKNTFGATCISALLNIPPSLLQHMLNTAKVEGTKCQKIKKEKKKNGDEDDNDKDCKKQKGLGRFLTLTLHGAKKYKVFKRLITLDSVKKFVLKTWFKQLVLGNEFGSCPHPHLHCHDFIATHEKMNFE